MESISYDDYIERPCLVKPPASLPKTGPKPTVDLPKVQNIVPARMYDRNIGSNIAQGTLMNKVFYDTPPILPPPGRRQSQLPIPVEDDDDADYLEFDSAESRGIKSLPDPRPQMPIPPRGVNLPTPGAKPPIPIGKPLPHKPPLSSEASQSKFGVLVPTPFIQRISFPRKQEGPLGNTSSGLISSPSIVAENTNFPSKPWYASKCDRKIAEAILRENGKVW
uniref:uncharacterized protein isoform X2 n=1 Tax=Pristiophorus japonicus TaxID=55135 RepID=UPI00398EFA38